MELDKLAPDFVALQAELSPVDKSADNPFFKSKFAPLPEVRKAMQPILAKHNFGLSVFPTIIRDEVGKPQNGLRFILLHASGQYIDGEWLLTPAKNDSQGQGADTTYKRRYGEMGITGAVADDDDDGNYASQPRPQAVVAKPAVKPAEQIQADLYRDELRDYAKSQKLDLAKVAAKFAQIVTSKGKPVALKDAPADDIQAFIVSLKTGAVTV
jgi:hypothetical protein